MNSDLQYLIYILKHKFFVGLAGLRWTRAPLWALVVHDLSKFSKEEWAPYREWFFGESAGTDKAAFKAAVKTHKARNAHHWEFWVTPLVDGAQHRAPIPERYIHEMVADWLGAGRAISGKWDAADYYAKQKDTMHLHPESRVRVEELLKTLPYAFPETTRQL